jgi:group I intron endonuclease
MMIEKMKNEYVIYKATNIITNIVYIGATTKSIEERRKDQIKKSKQGVTRKVYKAISTYGIEAFKWEQIDTAITTNELAKKEKEYILEYNSKEQGYNSDSGGGIQKTVYQYNISTGVLVNKYSNLTDASATVGLNKQDLSTVCLSVNKASKGFYWTYDYVEKFIPQKDKRRKVVYQYTIQGEFIKEFKSVSEASKETGCNKTGIAKVCRQERLQCGNFKWYYH